MFRKVGEKHIGDGHVGEKHELFDEAMRVVVLIDAVSHRHSTLGMQ